MSGDQVRGRLVWDLPVRIMHWSLLVAAAGCWLTQELEGDFFAWHVRCGYAVLGIVVVRILWGFVGTRYARFGAFLRGPGTVIAYIRSLVRGPHERHIGHNPLGALAVIVMLAMLLAQAVTGLFANDEIINTGPLFGYVTSTLSNRLTTVHEQLFDWLLAVVGLHIAAAFAYLWVKRENLIWPMVTGRKSAEQLPPEAAISGSRLVLWFVLVATVAAGIYWLVSTAPEASLGFF
jgi:cytochrome b